VRPQIGSDQSQTGGTVNSCHGMWCSNLLHQLMNETEENRKNHLLIQNGYRKHENGSIHKNVIVTDKKVLDLYFQKGASYGTNVSLTELIRAMFATVHFRIFSLLICSLKA
jgi:hypothetical protein